MVFIMTTFMKIEVALYYILKVLGYACGIAGLLGVIGIAGSLEQDLITMSQCFVRELLAFGLCGLSFVLFVLRRFLEESLYAQASRK
jgi:hypothetical protein